MRHRAGISTRTIILILAIVVAAIAVVLFRPHPANRGAEIHPATVPSSLPASVPTTTPATLPSPHTLLDVIRSAYPDYPTTQPLDERLDLRDAAAFVLSDPVYLCPRADLWITRADADALPTVLFRAYDERVHVLPERVLFIHWAPNEDGNWLPHLVVPAGNGFELVIPPPPPPRSEGRHAPPPLIADPKRIPLPSRPYDWSRAFTWNDSIVVPSSSGVSVLRLQNNQITDTFADLTSLTASRIPPGSTPQILLDARGLLAWLPPSANIPGSKGAFRFVDNKWTPLGPAQNWPESIVHLVPLLDGSVLQILPGAERDKVEIRMTTLDTPQVNPDQIATLVDNLADPNEKTRTAAFAQLASYGPGVWPILEKLLPDQPPESRLRLQQLLQNKTQPTLGQFSLVANDLRVVSRYFGGGALFYSNSGVTSPTEKDTPETISPAWLAILPGQPITLVSSRLTKDLKPETARLSPIANEWILSDDVNGPRRFNGVTLDPILPKSMAKFSEFIGKDHAGRWLFRQPASSSPPATRNSQLATLILDPSLPDATPRFPVWNYSVPPNGSVGWDEKGWPVIKAGTAFAIGTAGFRQLKPNEKMFAGAEEHLRHFPLSQKSRHPPHN